MDIFYKRRLTLNMVNLFFVCFNITVLPVCKDQKHTEIRSIKKKKKQSNALNIQLGDARQR